MRTVSGLVSDMRTGLSVLRSNTEYRLRSIVRCLKRKVGCAPSAAAGVPTTSTSTTTTPSNMKVDRLGRLFEGSSAASATVGYSDLVEITRRYLERPLPTSNPRQHDKS